MALVARGIQETPPPEEIQPPRLIHQVRHRAPVCSRPISHAAYMSGAKAASQRSAVTA
jgi:hypothetical protein